MDRVTPTVSLTMVDAVDLGHALCQRLADATGVRILFLKGPALTHFGLRAPQTSGDVDVLVDPAAWEVFVTALTQAGWQERASSTSTALFSTHSRTFIRATWPCDIDLHRFYPGFLADPQDAFEALWRRRRTLEFAHRPCTVPDRLAGVAVLSLHSLRGVAAQSRHRHELDGIVERARLTDQERGELVTLCRELGCVGTLETVLPRFGIHAAPERWELDSPELREWRGLVRAGANGAYRWLFALRRTPIMQRPRILWRAFWPSRSDLLLDHPEVSDSVLARLRARGRRLMRGAAAVPAAAVAAATNRSR